MNKIIYLDSGSLSNYDSDGKETYDYIRSLKYHGNNVIKIYDFDSYTWAAYKIILTKDLTYISI